MDTKQPCLQAENEQLRAGYDAARLEIESLKERVEQLGQLARDVNSRRVQELEAQLSAVAAPKKWAPEEVADGGCGIRWVTNEGVHGRPTDHDVREYLKRTPTANGCHCDDCKRFYAAASDVTAAPAQAGEYPEPSPTAGMSIAQRILHVGGRNNEAGYVEFGSTQAVDALVCQVLRDRAATWRPIATAPIDGKKILLRSKRGRIADGLWSAANSSAGFWTWAYVCQEPIEWMPLPASPAAIAAKQGGANG